MKKTLIFLFCFSVLNLFAAMQYNFHGNRGWLSFDSPTSISFSVSAVSGKEGNNFITEGGGIADYGWYNLDTGTSGSFANGLEWSFTENDKIGLYVKDNSGKTYITTKHSDKSKNVVWGKSRNGEDGIELYGGNFGSNGTHGHYVFKVNVVNLTNQQTPTGQPLPGILATLLIGGTGIWYLCNRKKLMK